MRSPPVWWYWLQMRREAPTRGQQRSSRSDAAYLVYEMLEFLLHRQHLLIKVRDVPARECVYRPRRVLAHYRDLLVDDLFASFASSPMSRNPPPAVLGLWCHGWERITRWDRSRVSG